MKKLLPKHLIIAVALLAAAGALYGAESYLLDSTVKNSTALQQGNDEKRAEVAKNNALKSASDTLDASEQEIASHFLKKDGVVSFLGSLEQSGKPVGAQVSVVSVSADNNVQHPRASVTLLVSGTFDAVMKTIGMLENSSYDSVVTNLKLDAGAQDKTATWSAAAVLSVALEPPATTTPAKKP